MSSEFSNNATKYLEATNTVARPATVQPVTVSTIVTGTVGHAGVVEYSKSATAMVSETYVVATKK